MRRQCVLGGRGSRLIMRPPHPSKYRKCRPGQIEQILDWSTIPMLSGSIRAGFLPVFSEASQDQNKLALSKRTHATQGARRRPRRCFRLRNPPKPAVLEKGLLHSARIAYRQVLLSAPPCSLHLRP